jgi:diguanylate cyclase (GGDEF)-like protein
MNEGMELFLWRWSTVLQVTSLVVIAAFFSALARSTPRAELRWWLWAWLSNLGALALTLIFWYFEPEGWTQLLVRGGYLWTKTTFVWLFLRGAWALVRPGMTVLRLRYALPTIAVFAIAGAFALNTVPLLGVGQHTMVALVFGFGAFALARARDASFSWLTAALALRALLATTEVVAYGLQVASPGSTDSWHEIARAFLSASSSIDTASEWLLALGAVLAVSERAHRELRTYNQRLLDAQEDLRRLVDRDPLTALANRRALPEIFRAVQPDGARLLFFDLDRFKSINDLHGHHTGDECLQRFASALRESFRPDDAVVRFGGDEFLVVASGLTAEACDERIAWVRDRLRHPSLTEGPAIRFSVGVGELLPGGRPDEALEAADQAMYRAKAAARRLRLVARRPAS